MTAVWETKRVGDILQLEYGKPLDQAHRNPDGRYPVYGANGEKGRSDTFYVGRPSIIVGRKGSAGEVNLTEDKFWPLDVTYFVTFDDRHNDLRFLYYLLRTLDLPSMARGIKPGINRNEVYSQVIRTTALPEQQRIVGILDEAFAAIATARAKAEENLRNADALFASSLHSVLIRREPAWGQESLESLVNSGVVQLTRGKVISKRDMAATPGDFPVYSSARENNGQFGSYGLFMFDEELITWSVDGGGKLFHRPRHKFSVTNVGGILRLRRHDRLTYPYLHRVLSYLHGQVRFDWVRKAHPSVILKLYTDIPVPSIEVQQQLVRSLDEIQADTERLASIYQRKLEALDALKQSLLHQAFTGAL